MLVSDFMRNVMFDKMGFEWAHYAALSPSYKRNLRHLFLSLEFSSRVEDAPLLESTRVLQNLLRQGKSLRQTPLSMCSPVIIPKKLHKYLFTRVGENNQKHLDIDRYDFFVYRLLRNALEAGDIYVEHSTEYHPFEDDLISDARWQNKETLLREIGAPLLLTPIQDTLARFHEALEAKFKLVNQRIAQVDNPSSSEVARAKNNAGY